MPLYRPEIVSYWRELAEALGVPAKAADPIYERLCAEYSRPERYYHNLNHIAFVLAISRDIAADLRVEDTSAIFLAGWFHDVIYDSRAGDNEEKSADYARKALGKMRVSSETINETARLILATKSHRAAPNDVNAQILLDADLAILGAPPDDYGDYARAIRKEYAWVPEEKYRTGRTQVLEGFLKREAIYFTDPMLATHEAQARRNIHDEISGLVNGKNS